jgi:hypothetical protein
MNKQAFVASVSLFLKSAENYFLRNVPFSTFWSKMGMAQKRAILAKAKRNKSNRIFVTSIQHGQASSLTMFLLVVGSVYS